MSQEHPLHFHQDDNHPSSLSRPLELTNNCTESTMAAMLKAAQEAQPQGMNFGSSSASFLPSQQQQQQQPISSLYTATGN